MTKQAKPVDTPAYHLFHDPIQVEIQNQFFYPPKYMAVAHEFVNMDREQKALFLRDYKVHTLSTIGIVMLFEKGVPTRIVQTKDLIKVYEWIKAHLANWAREIKHPYGRKPPRDDLLILDNFAEYISEHAIAAQRERDLAKGLPSDASTDIFSVFRSGLEGPMLQKEDAIQRLEGYRSDLLTAIDSSPWSVFDDGNS